MFNPGRREVDGFECQVVFQNRASLRAWRAVKREGDRGPRDPDKYLRACWGVMLQLVIQQEIITKYIGNEREELHCCLHKKLVTAKKELEVCSYPSNNLFSFQHLSVYWFIEQEEQDEEGRWRKRGKARDDFPEPQDLCHSFVKSFIE